MGSGQQGGPADLLSQLMNQIQSQGGTGGGGGMEGGGGMGGGSIADGDMDMADMGGGGGGSSGGGYEENEYVQAKKGSGVVSPQRKASLKPTTEDSVVEDASSDQGSSDNAASGKVLGQPNAIDEDFGTPPVAGKQSDRDVASTNSGSCSPDQAPTAIKTAAHHAVTHAIQQYGITDIVDGADIARAEGETANLLAWKRGGVPAACNAFMGLSVGQLGTEYGNDAAAILLELVSVPGAGEPEIYVPLEVMETYKRKHAGVPANAAPQIITSLGLPGDSKEIVISYLGQTIEDPTGKSLKLNYPRGFMVKAPLVKDVIDAIRENQ